MRAIYRYFEWQLSQHICQDLKRLTGAKGLHHLLDKSLIRIKPPHIIPDLLLHPLQRLALCVLFFVFFFLTPDP